MEITKEALIRDEMSKLAREIVSVLGTEDTAPDAADYLAERLYGTYQAVQHAEEKGVKCPYCDEQIPALEARKEKARRERDEFGDAFCPRCGKFIDW